MSAMLGRRLISSATPSTSPDRSSPSTEGATSAKHPWAALQDMPFLGKIGFIHHLMDDPAFGVWLT